MTLKFKQIIIAILGVAFLISLIFVQGMEVARRREEAGLIAHRISVPKDSRRCVDCHLQKTPGIIDHWQGSTHAVKGVACYDCHQAKRGDADAYEHEGYVIATIVTPLDCSRCHPKEAKQFAGSHHAKAGNILASLDNFLAETVEGSPVPFNPHPPTPGMDIDIVNGMASVNVGCMQCHGSRVALEAVDGSLITNLELQPSADGRPTNTTLLAQIRTEGDERRPLLHASSWPNTGIGRINLDGSLGSCSACHSRHDFSPRRARQPENCGKCHLGPDHPQKEIYEESKHGVAFRDLKDQMKLDAVDWVLGEHYSQAPTCATCHMSANSKNGGEVTHDPGERISWTNRPPVSAVMDTDRRGERITTTDDDLRQRLLSEMPPEGQPRPDDWKDPKSWQRRRAEMVKVCTHCHTPSYVTAFYKQYDDFVINYNEKFAKPGVQIMAALRSNNLLTSTAGGKSNFDEEIEWTWFYLWHHEGRRARHGASMMAPDYAHWHGMFEVAERFYMELIPQAREIAHQADPASGDPVLEVIEEILARPEHQWYERDKLPGAAERPPQSR